MLPDEVGQILREEGPVAIATASPEGPQLTGTWLSHVQRIGGSTLAFPVLAQDKTEENVKGGSPVQVLVASRVVKGWHGPGTAFRLSGHGWYDYEGDIYQKVKQRFTWARAALVVEVRDAERIF